MDQNEKLDTIRTCTLPEEVPLTSEPKINIHDMTFIEKLKYFKSNITVEPALAFFIMPSVLALLAAQNLNLDKACRVNLGYNDNVCTALRLRKRDNYTAEEDEVQKLIASVQGWKSVVHTAVPTILMLFIGAWSDKTGKRKICLLLPIFGEFMTCVFNLVNTYFFYEVSVEWTVFMEVISPSLTGGWYTMFLGTFSYLGDITSVQTRTFRLGILNLCMTIGFPVGLGLSGVMLKYFGYYGVFTISGFLLFLNFCYVLFRIEDHTWLGNKQQAKKSGCTGFLLEFFDIRSLKETLAIVFRKGANNRRLRICLILVGVCLTFGPLWGEMSVQYIFTRYRFNWDEVKYSIFSSYNLLAHSFGTLFAISVFSRKLKGDDAILGIMATSCKICGSVVLAFARYDYEIYLVPILEILSGTSTIALRSIASKLVSYQEQGKVYSLFGIAETMMPLIFAPLYSRAYIATLHVLPGTVFLMSVLATLPALGIFGWFYHQHRRDKRQKTLNINSSPIEDGEAFIKKTESKPASLTCENN